MNLFLLFIIAISLSMDAFSLSLAYGTLDINKKEIITLSIIVGIYHFFMPLIGFFLGSKILLVIPVNSNFIVQAKRIDKNFIVGNSGICTILITGDENETEVTLEEINSSFDVIQNAQTQCSAANRLFMANIHKSKIEYDTLSKLSLCFCPYKSEEPYPLINGGMNENYEISSWSMGYYDTQYIYDKTGYWPGELYRIGVVYILKDGSLSPVFNVRGATDIPMFNGSNYYYDIDQKMHADS